MASIRRIPGDTARRQLRRRFTMDFRTRMDGAAYDISDRTDVRIDVFDSNRDLASTWSLDNFLERPTSDRLLIDQTAPNVVGLGAGQYLLDIYEVTNMGAESFASMTLFIDPVLTGDYQRIEANEEVLYINFSSAAPGTTIEASSELVSRVDYLETQIANVTQGQLLFAVKLNFTALAAMATPLADTFVTVLNTEVIGGETMPKGQYLLMPTNQIIYTLTGDEYRPATT